MSSLRIAAIAGDGIGKEVMPEGLRVLDAAARRFSIAIDVEPIDYANCDYYAKHGTMLPEGWKFDAIFFGAVGWPATVPDHVSLWGSLLKFRREFDQYVNLRPAKLMPGVRSPLVDRQGNALKPGDIDMLIVRENTEGEYSSIGGRMYEGTPREIVIQETVMSRTGVDRVLKFAFDAAMKRPRRKLTSATKSNGISITMPYWDERVAEMAKAYPGVSVRRHPVGPGPGMHRHHRHRALGQPEPDARMAEPVRAGARLGTGHHRQRPGESDRADLVGGDDARVPRPSRRARCDPRRDREGARSRFRCSAHAGSGRQRAHRRCRPRGGAGVGVSAQRATPTLRSAGRRARLDRQRWRRL
jgi:Isocitrate/isopropylmalate dehydrogenase